MDRMKKLAGMPSDMLDAVWMQCPEARNDSG